MYNEYKSVLKGLIEQAGITMNDEQVKCFQELVLPGALNLAVEENMHSDYRSDLEDKIYTDLHFCLGESGMLQFEKMFGDDTN